MNVLVHEQGVRAHVVELHSRMQHAVPPVKVVEKVQRGRNAGAEVDEKVCDHDHIGLCSDDTFRPVDVGIDDPLAQDGVLEI